MTKDGKKSNAGWADIPDVLLLSIFNHLHNHRDIFSAAAVCRSWRSIASHSSSSSRPPLFLRPLRRSRCPYLTCQIISPTAPTSVLTSPFPFKPYAQHRNLIGSSHGRLLFSISEAGRRAVVLADVFTGVEIRTPLLPPYPHNCGPLIYACIVRVTELLVCTKFSLLRWRIGELAWEENSLQYLDIPVVQILEFGDRFFLLDNCDRVYEFSFEPELRIQQLLLPWPEENGFLKILFRKQLVECDGRVMAIVDVLGDAILSEQYSVYWLDFSQMKWVKVESLGDWCLFIGCLVRSPFACHSPGKWGGRSNCVYSISFGSGTWSVKLLDDTGDLESDSEAIGISLSNEVFHWPLPTWVYPGTSRKI